ncbi:MAG: cell division protein ZapA [Marinilabiliaceae bacterium]|nr:cell division protein ZapA [Marinilabiliaceae bacterium]
MDDKISIKINIAERQYPLRVERNTEERVRKAARLINEKITQYKQRSDAYDTQDALAMGSLQLIIKALEIETKNNIAPLIEALSVLDKKLENILEEK